MGNTIATYGNIANQEITHNGETRKLKDWSLLLDLDYTTVRMRYTRGKRGVELLHPTRTKASDKLREKDFKQLPSIIYTLDVDTRLALMTESDGDRDKMYDIISLALKKHLNT
jgi:hypothetical protein